MARASEAQHSINAGELSTLMLGRQDLQKYAAGLFVCLNAVPLAQGAWTRRPGTAFLHQVKFHDKLTRVLPFQYSVTQTYVLELGHQYIRFYADHGILTQAGQAISAVTNANPAVLTYVGADNYANGDRVFVTGVLGMTQLNNREFVVTAVNVGANTFELWNSDGTAVNSTGYDTYTSAGTISKVFEVVTTFTQTELAQVRITQSNDTLFIFHPTHAPQKLVRVSALAWTLSTISFTDGPYDTLNATTTTLTPSAFAVGAGVTLTASAITGINQDTGFQTTDVGRLIRILQGTTWGYVLITGRTSTTVVTVTILNTLTDVTAKVGWRMGVWSDTTGWPTCGTFHEDRLVLAGASGYPQRLDGSKSGLYTNFSPSSLTGVVADDSAIAFTLNSDDTNQIKWLQSTDKALFAGTTRGEWPIRSSTITGALKPSDINSRSATRYGSADAQPIQAARAVLFLQRAGRKLRELAYVYVDDGFRAPDMTLLSEHITRPSVTQLAYQGQPQAIVWGVRSDGVLLGFTYEREQDVVAWHRHEFGGQSDAAALKIPVVESLCVVPSPSATRDELLMVVQRYVNGGVRRYIEYMSKLWEVGDRQEDAFHADCGWTVVNGSPSTTVTGLNHLEGELVGVYADGAKLPTQTVTNGTITLAKAATIVTLGYWYESDGQTLPVEAGSQDGSAQGKIRRVHRVGFWLVDTLGLKFGPDANSLTEYIFRKFGDAYGLVTKLFTGVIRDRFEGDYDKLGQVYWRCDGPFPATVLAIMPQVETSDDS